jgi:hypothetical protein
MIAGSIWLVELDLLLVFMPLIINFGAHMSVGGGAESRLHVYEAGTNGWLGEESSEAALFGGGHSVVAKVATYATSETQHFRDNAITANSPASFPKVFLDGAAPCERP